MEWEYKTEVTWPDKGYPERLFVKMAKDGWELFSQSTIQTTPFTAKIAYTFRRRKKQ